MTSSPLSISSFPSFQVPGFEVKWTSSSLWDEALFTYYHHATRQALGQILKSPKSYRNTLDQSAGLIGQLILETVHDGNRQALGWAEIQLYSHRFSTAYLFYQVDAANCEGLEAAIGSLVSSCFFNLNCDQLRLITNAESNLKLPQWVQLDELVCLPQQPGLSLLINAKLDFIHLHTQTMSKGEWQRLASAQRYYQSLDFLRKRRERQEKIAEKSKHKRRKRSFMARLFRPKIDDSFF